jgi:hypothetical protein
MVKRTPQIRRAAARFELVEGISFNDLTPDPNTITIAPAVWETKDIDSQFVLTLRIEPGSYVIEIDTSVSEPAEATPLRLYFAEEGGSFCA